MPYKPTGRPAGRPKAEQRELDALDSEGKFLLPSWWIGMAELDAEWSVSPTDVLGIFHPENSRGADLARQFTSVSGGGKSKAMVSKVRSDLRYQEYLARRISEHEQLKMAPADQNGVAEIRAEIIAILEKSGS